MLAALLLASCASAPLYDMTGPVCPASREPIECGCSECFSWPPALADPVAGTAAAEWYEILRTNPDGTTQNVGSTQSRNRAPFHYRNGVTVPGVIVTLWCVPWDVSFPVEGGAYRYQVRGARNGSTAVVYGQWSTVSVQYDAAPYDCYAGGLEIACYPGDPVHRP